MNPDNNIDVNIQHENNIILDNIKSKYIIQNIFNYIKNSNIKFKLVNYSKYYQKKFDLTLADYQEKYFRKYTENLKIDILDYLTKTPSFNNKRLQEKLNELLLKYNFENNIHFQRYVLFCLQNYLNKNEFPLFIDIYSPFFDFVSNSDFFENVFVNIYINEKDEYHLQNDYISFFKKINKSNLPYPGISFYLGNIKEKKNYFEMLNINIKKIKRINLLINNNKLFDFLFSNDFKNNLLYLELNNENKCDTIETNILEKINEFQVLNELHLIGFIFEKMFILKLPNLQILYISNCNNITLAEESTLNIKALYFEYFKFEKQKYLFKFPELERCNFGFEEIYGIVDLSSLKKLKTISNIFANDFIHLESESLEKVMFARNRQISNQMFDETKIIKQILSLKKLKSVNFEINSDSFDILQINGKNYNIKELSINWTSNIDCILYNFQKQFPNLTELKLDFNSSKNDYDNGAIEIKESKECKINKFSLFAGYHSNIQFYIGIYENLISVNINICKINYKLDFKKIFPIFDKNCDIIFKNLKNFEFCSFDGYNSYDLMEADIIKNIYNNLDKMPCLKAFSMKCFCKNIGNFYIEFFKKLLTLNLEEIELMIDDNKKSKIYVCPKYELKEICPSIDFLKYKKLKLCYTKYNY